MEQKDQGILLQAIPYLGQKKILKVFTFQAGLLTLIAKSSKLSPLTSPFCIAEWVYQKSDKEVFSLKDGTLIDPLLELRASYDILSSAGSIASAVLRSQLPAQPSSSLYELLAAYLCKLGKSQNPASLAESFRIKLLIHDGLLSLRPHCAECSEQALALSRGESFCPLHGQAGQIFSLEEWNFLLLLGYSRKFSELENFTVAGSLREKASCLFEELIR